MKTQKSNIKYYLIIWLSLFSITFLLRKLIDDENIKLISIILYAIISMILVMTINLIEGAYITKFLQDNYPDFWVKCAAIPKLGFWGTGRTFGWRLSYNYKKYINDEYALSLIRNYNLTPVLHICIVLSIIAIAVFT